MDKEKIMTWVGKIISFFKEDKLTLATSIGVLIGIILGASLRAAGGEEGWTPRDAMYVNFIGELFLNMLRGIIIPLIIPSLIATIGSMNIRLCRTIGLRAIAYYIATINMNGTALYQVVAAISIAQMSGHTINFGQVLAISFTSTCANIGVGGIPNAGLTMAMVLETVGLPSHLVSMIMSVDWLLDRFRTAINVLGNSIGAGIVSDLSQEELKASDEGGTQEAGERDQGMELTIIDKL